MRKKLLVMLGIGTTLLFGGGQAFAATYQIQAGDTLWNLSRTFHVSVADLQNANPNIDPLYLLVGQTIHVPGNQTYTVQQNETLWSIAQSHHVSLKAILAANPNVDPLNIYPGLTITIPDSNAVNTASGSSQSIMAANGQSLQYSEKLNGVATAYTATAASNGSWGDIDYFGNPLKLGTIAVDPNEIPLGSKLYITGYSFDGLPAGGMICNASDIGGGVKGNHIDIFVPTSDANASNFGMQNVKIYILK